MAFNLEQKMAGGSREGDHVRAEQDPEVKADHILDRIWNRKDATSENALTHEEALHLLLYGKEAGRQLIEEEMEYGRYEPDDDVRKLLEKGEQPKEEDETMH